MVTQGRRPFRAALLLACGSALCFLGAERSPVPRSKDTGRREAVAPVLIALAGLYGGEAANAQAAAVTPGQTLAGPSVDVPDRINADPYELIGMEDPDNKKEDYKTFYMKQKYRADTYQVMKHMKISASLDKGTPNMERWNTRIKKEMNDWLAIYRRQNVSVGRQSYYSLYSAINTLASHFTSYGPKFPFPNKRRPRFFELCQQVEKYLEKGK
mmetsp:Transcript_76735/g.106575  ORF Transcript_76735/g.106575 Transcript_76735/m.106575 type:complete len:213 (-) Transcript_76735:99-737(-)|eukprot:symbB.v1.2.001675.t1/scaffold86.1/size363240/34